MKKKIILLVCIIAALCSSTFIAEAKVNNQVNEADLFYPDNDGDRDMADTRAKRNILTRGVQYGGWISPVFVDERNISNNLTTSLTTAKLWLPLPGVSLCYPSC